MYDDSESSEYEDRPRSPVSEIPRAEARSLLHTFTTFLTLMLHTLLYHRGLYPPQTFLIARHHGLPVPQSRHPAVCSWIIDAVNHIRPLLAASRLAKVTVNFHLPRTLEVAERWVIDVSHFPLWMDGNPSIRRRDRGRDRLVAGWERRERRHDRESRDDEDEREIAELEQVLNWVDVDEAIRGALRRIAHAAAMKGHLPDGSTYTVAVELREDAPAPIGHPQPWIPSDPSLQSASRINPAPGSAAGGASTIPLRTVEAGPLFFECWVEECPAPRPTPTSRGDSSRGSNLS